MDPTLIYVTSDEMDGLGLGCSRCNLEWVAGTAQASLAEVIGRASAHKCTITVEKTGVTIDEAR